VCHPEPRPARAAVLALPRSNLSHRTAARTAAEQFTDEMRDAESELELSFLRLLVENDLPLPTPQFRPPWAGAEVQRVDGAYELRRVVVELDSVEHHHDAAAFQRDRRRDQLAAQHGWRTVRFTSEQVFHRPWEVLSTLRRMLEL